MAYASVLSPFTAYNLGQATYCSGGGSHQSGFSSQGFCCPIDIGGSAYIAEDTPILFYASSIVGSIRIYHDENFCIYTPPVEYEYAVIVHLYRYADAQCYIGKLFYGHVNNRVSVGVYNRSVYQGMSLGTILRCCADCYGGVHVHIGRDEYGESPSLACNQVLYEGSSWFYRWYWEDTWCP